MAKPLVQFRGSDAHKWKIFAHSSMQILNFTVARFKKMRLPLEVADIASET
jgi:hypothetical protein